MALIYHEATIEALEPVTGEQLWQAGIDDVLQPLWLGQHGDLLLLATPFQVFALDRLSGEHRWRFGRLPPQADSPAIDPEELRRLAAHARHRSTLVSIYDDDRAVGLRVTDGHELWRQRLQDPYRGPAAMNDRHLAYVSALEAVRGGGMSGIAVLDAATGAPVQRIERNDGRQITWLRFSLRGLLAAGSDWVACYEPATGELLWQVDPLPRNQVSAMRVSGDVLYLCPGREVLALSLVDGRPLWRSERSAGENEPLVATWLDLGDFFVVSSHTLESFEAAGGNRRWTLRLPPDLTVILPVLTPRSILAIGVQAADSNDFRLLQACFVDRYFGGPRGPDGKLCQDLLETDQVPQVRAYQQAVLVRDERLLIGYASPARAAR